MGPILTVVFATVLSSAALQSQSLSEQNLIDLKKAGVNSAVLIQQIEKDGINFQMDAAATIRLKNLGFPDEVLSALIDAGGKKASTAPVDPIKALYAQGKYPELCDYLKSQLSNDHKNYRLRAILIGALLTINQQANALAELEALRAESSDPASKTYVERASLMVSTWQKQQEGKQRLLAALQNYNYADADSTIDQLPASDLQKQMLHMAIDSYAAKFDTALTRKSHLPTVSFSDKQYIDVIEVKIKDSQKQYSQLMDRVDYYLYWPSSGTCSTQDPKRISISNYIEVVSKLARLAPMSPEVMDLVFHAALLSTQYESLQSVGDQILAAKGTIEIPFYSKDRYFTLVVDTKLRSIYTRLDSHRFETCVVNGGLFPTGSHPSDHNDYFSELVPFNLQFDQIRSISQNAGLTMGVAIVKHSYALSLEPAGVAPNYALMHWLYAEDGVQAGMQATHNLGQFVLHVIGNPTIKANLVNPKKTGSSGVALGDALVAMYGATHGNTPVGTMATQTYEQGKEMLSEQQTEQQASWEGMLAHDYSALFDGSVFEGLDKLIESQ